MSETRRKFQNLASSGEVTEMYMNGVENNNKVPTIADIVSAKGLINFSDQLATIDATDTFTVIPFDNLIIQRNGISADLVNHYLAITNTNLYEIAVGFNIEFDSNREVEVHLFINGNVYNETGIFLQGSGAGKPVSMFWETTALLSAGDIVDFRVRCVGATDTVAVKAGLLKIKSDR